VGALDFRKNGMYTISNTSEIEMDRVAVNNQIRKRMQAVKQKNTEPEMLVKKALRQAKIPYLSGQGKHKPNSADILLPRQRLAIFVHGCFWHGHPGCRRATVPTTRTKYWKHKILTNQKRDKKAMKAFVGRGWIPLVIWECEIRDQATLSGIIQKLQNVTYESQP